MKKWYENLKEGDKVLMYTQFSSNPTVDKFCGFFNGHPVIGNTVFTKVIGDVLHSGDCTAYAMTEKYLLESERAVLLERVCNLRIWDDYAGYTNEDFKKLIAFHEEIINR